MMDASRLPLVRLLLFGVLVLESLSESACLITDVRLPQMDGLELQGRLKAERPGMHVIFITAYRDESGRRRGLEQGAVCFLYKPFNPEELLAALERALNESSTSC